MMRLIIAIEIIDPFFVYMLQLLFRMIFIINANKLDEGERQHELYPPSEYK